MNRHSGFTLIELLVTLTIAAILAGVGIPALQNMMMTNRRVAVVNALVADVQHARSTASSLYQPVVLCASTGAGCAEAGSNWANGWLVFVDENDDGVFDAGEKVLSRAAPQGADSFQPGELHLPSELQSRRCGRHPGGLHERGPR